MGGSAELNRELTSLLRIFTQKDEQAKQKAVGRLVDLSCEADNRRIIVGKTDVLDALVKLLKQGSMNCKEKAAAVIGNLALDRGSAEKLSQHSELLKSLVSIFYTKGSPKACDNSARALGNLGNSNETILSAIIATPGALQAIIDLLKTPSATGQEQAAAILWDMAQEELVNSTIPSILENLIGVMQSATGTAQENASGALCTICLIDQEEAAQVLDVDGFWSACSASLQGTDVCAENTSELIWTLVSGGHVDKVCSQAGVCIAMVKVLQNGSEAAVESIVAAIRSIAAASHDAAAIFVDIPGGMSALIQSMHISNSGIGEDSAGAVWNMAFHPALRLRVAKADGLLDAFLTMIEREEDEVGPLENVAGAMRMLTAGQGEATSHLALDITSLAVLTEILKKRIDSPMEDTCAAVWNIVALIPDKKGPATYPDLVDCLIEVCIHGMDHAKQNAVGALGNLSLDATASELILQKSNCLDAFVCLLETPSREVQEHSAAALGNLAMDSEQNMIAIAKHPNILEALVDVIKHGSDVGKENAVAALGNLALNASNMAMIARPGAMAALGSVLEKGSDKAKENAALTIGNLVLNSPGNAELIVEEGAMLQALVNLLKTGSQQATENAALAISHVAVNVKDEELLIKIPNCINYLVLLVQCGSDVAREDAAAAMGNIALRCETNMEVIGAHSEAITSLVGLLKAGTPEAVENACLALGNLSLHSNNEGRIVQTKNSIDFLAFVLKNGTETAREAAAKVIANIAATDMEHKKAIGKVSGIIDGLVSLLAIRHCQRSATAALLNLSGTDQNRIKIAKAPNAQTLLESIATIDAAEGRHALMLLRKFPDFEPSKMAKPTAPKKSTSNEGMGLNFVSIDQSKAAPSRIGSGATPRKSIVANAVLAFQRSADVESKPVIVRSLSRKASVSDAVTPSTSLALNMTKLADGSSGFKQGVRTQRTSRTARTARTARHEKLVVTAKEIGE